MILINNYHNYSDTVKVLISKRMLMASEQLD